MKRILLMRHSIAEHGSTDITDEERPLTTQGIQLIKTQALKLQQLNILPDFTVSSHAVRAFTTAKIIAEQLNLSNALNIEPFLYRDFTTQEFINYVHKLPGTVETIIIVGHNPTISTSLQRLTALNNYSFPPAAIAILNLGLTDWNSITVGQSKLEHYLSA